jgi:hypothetical protein
LNDVWSALISQQTKGKCAGSDLAEIGACGQRGLAHLERVAAEIVAVQLNHVVEFSHSIDSLRHPLIQLSDLVIYTTRKFLECDNGYRPNWTAEARNFFASCYDRVQKRMWWTNLIDVEGEEEQEAHALLKLCQSTHNGQWNRNYTIT